MRELTATTLPMPVSLESAFAEHALEDGVDMLEVIAEVELLLDLRIAEIFLHAGVFFQQRLEIAFAAPHRHRVALYQRIGFLARAALLRQWRQQPLRMNESP